MAKQVECLSEILGLHSRKRKAPFSEGEGGIFTFCLDTAGVQHSVME